jgi:hypothetical protein
MGTTVSITNGYATLDDIKVWLGISDAADDSLLEACVEAASRAIDSYCGRRFWYDSSATARTYRASDCSALIVDDFGTTTGLIVATDDSDTGSFTTWAATDYEARPVNRELSGIPGQPFWEIAALGYAKSFPTTGRRSRVQVTARWGWAAVPDPVAQACLIKSARLFRRKQTPQGFAAGEAFGAIRVSQYEDPDAVMLLSPYRRFGGSGLVVA